MKTIAAGIITALLMTGVTFAQQSAGDTNTTTMQVPGQEAIVTAVIAEANVAAKTIGLTNDQGQRINFTLTNDTQIINANGEKKKMSDLKPGSRVTVTYTPMQIGNPTVSKVEIK